MIYLIIMLKISLNKPCYDHSLSIGEKVFFLDSHELSNEDKILIVKLLKSIFPKLINNLNKKSLDCINDYISYYDNCQKLSSKKESITSFFEKQKDYYIFIDFLETILYELKETKIDRYDCETCGSNEYLEYYLKE